MSALSAVEICSDTKRWPFAGVSESVFQPPTVFCQAGSAITVSHRSLYILRMA
jgi:hypothetical protein